MSYCKKCGTELPDGAKFCSECGTPVNGEDLDTKLKKEQLENEKNKKGCMTWLVGTFISGVLLFTAGPLVAGVTFLIWMVIGIVEMVKK